MSMQTQIFNGHLLFKKWNFLHQHNIYIYFFLIQQWGIISSNGGYKIIIALFVT